MYEILATKLIEANLKLFEALVSTLAKIYVFFSDEHLNIFLSFPSERSTTTELSEIFDIAQISYRICYNGKSNFIIIEDKSFIEALHEEKEFFKMKRRSEEFP